MYVCLWIIHSLSAFNTRVILDASGSCLSPFQIPIVENEIKKEAGEGKPEEEVSAAPAAKLVTEMGTYVTQSALSSSRPSKKEEDR